VDGGIGERDEEDEDLRRLKWWLVPER